MSLVPGLLTVTRLGQLAGHRDCLYTLSALAEPGSVVTAGADGMVVWWDTQDPADGHLLARMAGAVYAMHFTAATGLLCIGQNQEGLHWLRLEAEEAKPPKASAVASLHLGLFDVFSLAEVRPGMLVVGLSSGEACLVDVPSVTVVARANHAAPQMGQQRSLRALLLLEGGLIAAGYSDGWVRLLSPESLSVIEAWRASEKAIFTLTLLPATLNEGPRLLAGGRDGQLRTFNWQTGKLLQEVAAHNYAINHTVLSPDGQLLVSCSMDKSIKVWDAADLRLIKVIDKARHAGHGTSVNRLCYVESPSAGPILVSCSDDRSATLWSLSVV